MTSRASQALRPSFTLFTLCIPALCFAQNAHVNPGESLAMARGFASVRVGESVLVAYLDNAPGAHGELRTALFRSSLSGLDRQRPDITLSPSARTLSLVWDGTRGAVAYILPPAPPPVPPPGSPPRRFLPTPPSPAEPLGARNSSGGDIRVQRLDAQGLPEGPVVQVFTEHSHAVRVALALEPDGWVVAWTGAAYTDQEVRGTVRAVRLPARQQAPSYARSTSWFGDTGDVLRIASHEGHTRVMFTGMRCLSVEGTHTPTEVLPDPSARVEVNHRSLQPQASITLDQGPLIECGELSLHSIEFRPDGTFGAPSSSPPIAHDAFALGPSGALTPLGASPGALAWLPLDLAPAPAFRAVSSGRHPSLPLSSLGHAPSRREHPAADFDPALRDLPVIPSPPIEASLAVHEAVFLDARAWASGTAVLSLPTDHHRVLSAVLAPDGTLGDVSEVYQSSALLLDAAVLPGTNPWLLVLEGSWGGPLRLLDPNRALPRVPYDPLDSAWAALFVHVRTARAVFMRYENTAGAMAARPEAPTDPRMPGVLSNRSRLRARWTNLCDQLTARARWLSHHGGPADILQATRQVCEIHPDLQLGVPVNPAL